MALSTTQTFHHVISMTPQVTYTSHPPSNVKTYLLLVNVAFAVPCMFTLVLCSKFFSQFTDLERQRRGSLHLHFLLRNLEYDPRLDMRIHYDPKPAIREMLYKMQGLSSANSHIMAIHSTYTYLECQH
jgi:hypothetical protein